MARSAIHLRVGFGDVIKNEIFDLPFNVSGLVAHRHLCKTGQINKSQVEDARTINLEVDWKLGNALKLPDMSAETYFLTSTR